MGVVRKSFCSQPICCVGIQFFYTLLPQIVYVPQRSRFEIRKLQAIGMMRADSCFDVRLPEEPNPPLSPCILGAEIGRHAL
jgi:hypothetical protein